MKSPCVNVCKIDPHTEMCLGCNRYVEEIEVWSILTDDERSSIMNKLMERSNEKTKESKNGIHSVRKGHSVQTESDSG